MQHNILITSAGKRVAVYSFAEDGSVILVRRKSEAKDLIQK